jgi:hypothetical protein
LSSEPFGFGTSDKIVLNSGIKFYLGSSIAVIALPYLGDG